MRSKRQALSLKAPSGRTRVRHRWVIVGLGLLAFVVCSSVSWLLGDFGVQERRIIHKVALEAPAPLPPVARTIKVEDLPLEPRRSPLTGTENILIAGMDRRPGAKGSGLTDTLIVVALEKQTGRVGLISIPRDIAIEVPNHGLDRINTVYGLAQAHGENALTALKHAVGDLLALSITHALVVDLAVFEQLIDTLGGITVNVACPIVDDFVDSRMPDGRRVLDVKEGQVHMNGTTAAMYVRSRHGRSDFSRARRQQSVLNAIHRELLTLGNLGHLPDAFSAIEHSVSTDLKRYELLQLAQRALSVKAELVHAVVISESEIEPLIDHGRAMLTPKLDAIDLAVSKLFVAPAPGVEHHAAACPRADIALRRKEHTGTLVDAGTQTVESAVEVVTNDHVTSSRH